VNFSVGAKIRSKKLASEAVNTQLAPAGSKLAKV
jgi:hypothetical protein